MTTTPPADTYTINNVLHTVKGCKHITNKTSCTVLLEWSGKDKSGSYMIANSLIKAVDDDGNEVKAESTQAGKQPADRLGGFITLYKGKPLTLTIIFPMQGEQITLNYLGHLTDIKVQ